MARGVISIAALGNQPKRPADDRR